MKNSNVVWALVAGLAVGYIVGNKLPMNGGGSGGSSSSPATRAVESGSTAIPADWITEKELGAETAFAGLTPAQRFTALKVLNSKPCDCGCPHGTIAKCKKEDPNCPVAPSEIALAASSAKAGKSYEEVYAATKKGDAQAARPAEPTSARVLLASWTPVKGPKYAKVTVLEFSDFQ
ncbi:MAG: hypothetical protein ACXVAN_16825 [Polyangia bacterium]